MPKTATPKPDDPEQLERFKRTAREVAVDESEGAFDRAFDRVAGNAKSKSAEPQRRGREKRS